MGLGYGLILGVLSFLLTGAGHGTYLPLAISSAPLVVIDYAPPFTFVIGLLGCPALWVFVASISCGERWRSVFRAALIMHYLGVVFAVIRPIEGDWSYFVRMLRFSGPAVVVWMSAYVIGQAMIWSWSKQKILLRQAKMRRGL
jgi:uncharacterized integral membrane protein